MKLDAVLNCLSAKILLCAVGTEFLTHGSQTEILRGRFYPLCEVPPEQRRRTQMHQTAGRKSSGRVLMWSRQYQDQASKEGTSGTMNEQEQDLWNTAGVLTVSLHAHIRRATVIDLQSQTNTKVWLFLSCKRTEWLMKTLDWTSSRSSSDRTPPTSSALNESSISSLTLRWSLSSPLTSSPLLWRPGVRRQNCSTLPLT